MRLSLTALITALVFTAQQAASQSRNESLEEVIVTAQHRTESAIATPVSLFTMNSEQLEKQRIGPSCPPITVQAPESTRADS